MADKRAKDEVDDIGVAKLYEECMTSGEIKQAEEKVLLARKTAEEVMKGKSKEELSLDVFMKVMMEKMDSMNKDLKGMDKNVKDNNLKMDGMSKDLKEEMRRNKEEIIEIMDRKVYKVKAELQAEIVMTNERINFVEEKCEMLEGRMESQNVKIEKIEDDTEKMAKSRLRVAEEKINQRIDRNNQEIDEKIGSIKGDMEKFKKEQQATAGITANVDWSNIEVGMLGGIKKDIIPSFVNDSTLHPVKYIENVREIVTINLKNNYQMYHNKIMFLIKNTLKGEPKLWFNTIENVCTDFQKFVELFLKQYWGIYHQNKCRNKLILGRYDKNKVYKSRERYALEIYNESMYLEPRINERDLLSRIADHFGEDVALQVVVKDMDSLGILIEYLRRIDDKDNQVRHRRTNLEVNNTQINTPRRGVNDGRIDNFRNNDNNYNYQRNIYNESRGAGERNNNNYNPGRYNGRNNYNRQNFNYGRARENFNNGSTRNQIRVAEVSDQSRPITQTDDNNEQPQQNRNF